MSVTLIVIYIPHFCRRRFFSPAFFVNSICTVHLNHCSKYTFFYKQRFFSSWTQCCLTFSWIELNMMLRSWLIYISTIILGRFLYLVYLCPCLDLLLFMSYPCNLFLILFSFSWWFNHAISLEETYFFFCTFLNICPTIFRW